MSGTAPSICKALYNTLRYDIHLKAELLLNVYELVCVCCMNAVCVLNERWMCDGWWMNRCVMDEWWILYINCVSCIVNVIIIVIWYLFCYVIFILNFVFWFPGLLTPTTAVCVSTSYTKSHNNGAQWDLGYCVQDALVTCRCWVLSRPPADQWGCGPGRDRRAVLKIQYIPRNMHTFFALLCFVVVIHWLIFPYPSGLLHWHCGNLTIAPVSAKQSWWIWINTSCEFIMNDCITTTKQSTTKPCAYFLGYTVARSRQRWQHAPKTSGPCLNIKTVLSTYGDFYVKDKTAVRTSYL